MIYNFKNNINKLKQIIIKYFITNKRNKYVFI